MNVNSAVERGKTQEPLSSSVSWDAIQDDPVARWKLLGEARKMQGAREMIAPLFDHIRAIAASPPEDRENLKENLADMLAALGMELASGDAEALAGASDVRVANQGQNQEKGPASLVETVQTSGAAGAARDQKGFASSRPTPYFSVPMPVAEVVVPEQPIAQAEPAVQGAGVSSVTPVRAEIQPTVHSMEEWSLDEIKNGVAETKERVGFQRLMEALKGSAPEDQEYAAALNALSALGNPDTAPIATLRQAYERFARAAEPLAVARKAPPQEAEKKETNIPPTAPTDNAYQKQVLQEGTVAPYESQPEARMQTEAPLDAEGTVPANDLEALAEATLQEDIPAETQPTEDLHTLLMSREVTEGLNELLSQWGPFEKSGIFGLGKHGIEHPLYKQLAGLPVTAVLSKRWEGADQAVINNVQLYTDGWKKDLGIEANPEETFDTYLRRIVSTVISANQDKLAVSQPAVA